VELENTYYGERKSLSQIKGVHSELKDKENKMIKEINSLVSGLSTRKAYDEKSRSRMLSTKNTSNLFSIKNGINRPNQIYY
jgi:vacuolar-type H+-ATPase subunit D/Vma8